MLENVLWACQRRSVSLALSHRTRLPTGALLRFSCCAYIITSDKNFPFVGAISYKKPKFFRSQCSRVTLCYTMWQVTEKNNRKSGRVLHLKHWFSSLTVLNDTTARWCESSMVTPAVTDRTWAKLNFLTKSCSTLWLHPPIHYSTKPGFKWCHQHNLAELVCILIQWSQVETAISSFICWRSSLLPSQSTFRRSAEATRVNTARVPLNFYRPTLRFSETHTFTTVPTQQQQFSLPQTAGLQMQ